MLFAFSGRAARNFLALLVVTRFIPLCRPGQPGRARSDATGPCSPFGCRRTPYATKTTGCSSVMAAPSVLIGRVNRNKEP
jgi:hypothetical protein